MFFQCVDSSHMFDFPVLAICACSESDGLTEVFCFMTIVVANYRYVNCIHEAKFTWKRILQDALWDDGNRIPSLSVWTNPSSILTFMEYNPNVILLTACSHYVINYLHKFSCPPENGFWPGSPESKQGVPAWVSAHVPYTLPACHARCPAHAASVLASSWNPHGVPHTVRTWLITRWRWDMRMDMRGGGDSFFWNAMIWQRVHSLFCFRESPVRLILF